MKLQIITASLLILSLNSFANAGTCTGETGDCHGPVRTGEYLSIGSKYHNFLELKRGGHTSYAGTFYRHLPTNQASGSIGYEMTLVRSIPHLFECSMTIRSGVVGCMFKGPLQSERKNLIAGLPAKLNKKTSLALDKMGGTLEVVPGGLVYFCEPGLQCYVQIEKSAFAGGVVGDGT